MRPASHCQTKTRRPDNSKSLSARTRASLALFAVIIVALMASISLGWAGSGHAAAPAATAPTAHEAVGDYVSGFLSAALFQSASESIQTYAADCVTPKDDFNLGETMCVKADIPFILLGRRNINIVGPSNVVRASVGVSGVSQTLTFTLPTTPQTVIDGETFDNRGSWRADLTTVSGARRASAFFDVSAPTAAADLQLIAAVNGDDTVGTGQSLSVSVYVFNAGPDPATNVVVTPPSSSGLALQSFAPASGPDCGPTCTIASLGRRSTAKFVATYNVTAAAGTKLAAQATVQSDTEDPQPLSNSTFIFLSVSTPTNATCMLTCPANVVATANTTVGGQFGALVTYGAASVDGDCGAVTNSPTSGSFFPVGTHTVTSSATGDSCTFTVTVFGTPAPTISCPADKTAIAASGADDATVVVGTPTFTANGGGTVTSLRSDSTPPVVDEDGNVITPAVPKALTDPYPIGITSIVWTVTDADGRTASCTQKIIVSDNACGSDTTPPTITAPDDITVGTGVGNTSCGVTLDDELGQPEVSDACTVTVTISGLPAGNNFVPGTYTLTYKAKDAAGNEATDTQVVTVVENTPPVIKAPANATYTCLSEVPAASPSQATRGNVFDEDGNLLPPGPPFDNCGVPAVTVTETSTGAGSAASPKVITRTFTATDAAGNTASDVQTITVIDPTPPTLALNGPASMTVECHTSFTDPGATASDNCAGNLTGAIIVSGSVNVNSPGTYTLTYTVSDSAGNTVSTTRTVNVVDTTPPTISCQADILVNLDPAVSGAVVTYSAPTGTDSCAGTLTATQIGGLPSGSVFPPGTTTNTFRVTDGAGLTASCSFKVTVALTSIVGLDSVSITGAGPVDSYDSNGGYPATKGSQASVVSNGTITMSGSAKVSGSVRSTRAGVVMSGASQVTGNATAGTTVSRSGSASVGGTITNNALAPVLALPAVSACGAYSSNSGISGSYSYNASTGDLSLTGVNVATLANGTYCFHNLSVGNSAQLKVNGPVTIKLTGTLSTSGASQINNTTLIPGNLRILSSYSGSNGVSFGNSTNAYLVIYAPQTGVTISGAVPLFGTVTGKTITISNSGMIHYDTRLQAIWPTIWQSITGP